MNNNTPRSIMSTQRSESPAKVPGDGQIQNDLTMLEPHIEALFDGHPYKDNLTVGIVDMQTPYAFVTNANGKLVPITEEGENPAGKWKILYCHCKEQDIVFQTYEYDPPDLVQWVTEVKAGFDREDKDEKKRAKAEGRTSISRFFRRITPFF
ncbi:hypothetical protein HBI65_226750 [Parastagonospora nodorum]|nr:hypothetical protein HBI65_226750 [Parastagonospora nodorum]